MKLVRFGEAGKERPGVLDKDGHVRDLSAHVKDISGDVLSDDGSEADRGDRSGEPAAAARRRAARRAGGDAVEIRRDRTELQRPRRRGRHAAADRADHLPESRHLDLRPERSGREAARLDQARLGGRARHRDRQAREVHRGGRGLLAHRRLLPRQRRLRAQLPARAAGTVDQGQVARHVRPARPVARHQGRDPRSAEPEDVARRQRRAAADRHDRDDDLQGAEDRVLRLAFHDAAARRRDHHRHAARRRLRQEAAALPECRATS